MYRYFVSFVYKNKDMTFAFNNAVITMDAKITDIKDIRDVEAKIDEEFHYLAVSITGFRELDVEQNNISP